jgi:hypothetical protein
MINLFKSNPRKKLQKKYELLLKEAYTLSTVNRRLSDEKYAEAAKVLEQIEVLNDKKD